MDLIFASGYLDIERIGCKLGRLKVCLLFLLILFFSSEVSLSFNLYIRNALVIFRNDACSQSYLFFFGLANKHFRIQNLALHWESTVLLVLRSVEQSQITPEISIGVPLPEDKRESETGSDLAGVWYAGLY